MMFLTTTGSTYTVNQQEKTISGGALGDAIVPYETAIAVIGRSAIIDFTDGRVMRTSPVVSYL